LLSISAYIILFIENLKVQALQRQLGPLTAEELHPACLPAWLPACLPGFLPACLPNYNYIR